VQDRQRVVDLSSGQPEAPEAPAAAGSESRVLVNGGWMGKKVTLVACEVSS
jgi:hypothetical protein